LSHFGNLLNMNTGANHFYGNGNAERLLLQSCLLLCCLAEPPPALPPTVRIHSTTQTGLLMPKIIRHGAITARYFSTPRNRAQRYQGAYRFFLFLFGLLQRTLLFLRHGQRPGYPFCAHGRFALSYQIESWDSTGGMLLSG